MFNERIPEKGQEETSFVNIPKGQSVDKLGKDDSMDVKEVFLEIKVIMVNEMLTGFSLTRSISHQINLIPGSILTNKELHRMMLMEYVKFNR